MIPSFLYLAGMQNLEKLAFKKLTETAIIPTRGSAMAAGLDLYADEDFDIPQGGRAAIRTGIAVAIPNYHYGRMAPRSGLAMNFGLDVGAGVVDSDYRGELRVILFNFGDSAYHVTKGDRVA